MAFGPPDPSVINCAKGMVAGPDRKVSVSMPYGLLGYTRTSMQVMNTRSVEVAATGNDWLLSDSVPSLKNLQQQGAAVLLLSKK